ncbi:MAG: GntR family transcriptional regulator [Gemmatimonadota bacterium]|nr:MAG: GntR family transcriptional regulator [Gemmatimonadota bacterium]
MTSVPRLSVAKGDTAVKIATSLEAAVRDGRLQPGQRLPTVRQLAEQLGRSPTTITAAYAVLRSRGIIASQGRRGTFVSPRQVFATRPDEPAPPNTRDLASGNPDPDLLPDYAEALARISPHPVLYGADPYEPDLLREARALFEADGVPADHISVASGALDAIERAMRASLRPGDRVIVEDPGYFGVFDLLAGLGLRLVPIPVDDHGPRPEALAHALKKGAAAFVYTPRAQNPTGAALGEARVRTLRQFLTRCPDLLVIEDDHAGSIAGPAPPPLRGQGAGRWLTVRSVSKTLGPDLRVALLAGDADTIRSLEDQQRLGMRWVSRLLQQTVYQLLTTEAARPRLTLVRDEYARRRTALLDAVHTCGLEAYGPSGLNVWIPLREEGPVVRALAERGWAVAGGERFRIRTRPAIRVTTATLLPHEAYAFAEDLSEVLRPAPHSATT